LEKAYPVGRKTRRSYRTGLSRYCGKHNPTAASGVKSIAPLLLGMAVVVLLVACLNLANMLLCAWHSAPEEIAIRLALGGSRWRIRAPASKRRFLLLACSAAWVDSFLDCGRRIC